MKFYSAILSLALLVTLDVKGQSLETVTGTGNTTTNAMYITGYGNYNQNVDAIGLTYYQGKGYLDAVNPSTAAFKPLLIRGSSIEFYEGNVGMGTAPTTFYKLTTKGPIWASSPVGSPASASLPNFYISSDAPGVSDFEVYTNTIATYMGPFQNRPFVFVRNGGTETMRIDESGNVGIGTSNPNGYKLAVAGTAIAQKVKVTTASSNWPDYVFHKEYVLPSLQEVAAYIATHQHLPEIPSAAEVEKNGLDLGEMNKQLLKKVEELTLYIIQQQQETEGLKNRVKALEKK